MNRATIRSRFRSENPEITDRVLPDATLNGWMYDADKITSAETKCVISNVPESFTSTIGLQYYDLTSKISKFYDIDEYPGGGIWCDDIPLDKASEAEMNYILRNWKSAGNTRPQKYFRRGQYLWFDYAPDVAYTIDVSTVFISDDFDDDAKTPFNQLSYLEPFHSGVLKYIQWKAKAKVGKDEEAGTAEVDYRKFVIGMKKNIQGGQNNAAYLINRSSNGATQ